ncbi:MAG TPA: heterodisulfide reductase-related iron-sulfur binding cluster, partial [bacterium]|nr:heterodisulfide reductase-related iron-sulfur binding cluster [bacterium]
LANEHRRAPLPLAGGGSRHVLVHGHCHEKALAGVAPLQQVLTAAGYTVEMVDAGCCGMAGSFGFEKEHYEISMAIGERRLLPAVRRAAPEAVVAAPGVSCRQQIAHGTGRRALHLVELLQPAAPYAREHAAPVS